VANPYNCHTAGAAGAADEFVGAGEFAGAVPVVSIGTLLTVPTGSGLGLGFGGGVLPPFPGGGGGGG
jgi:hypothetical protein